MVAKKIGDFLEYREVTGTPPGKLMGLLGHSGEREGFHRRWRAPTPTQTELDKGWGRDPPFLLPLPPFPFPLSVRWEEGGRILLGTES